MYTDMHQKNFPQIVASFYLHHKKSLQQLTCRLLIQNIEIYVLYHHVLHGLMGKIVHRKQHQVNSTTSNSGIEIILLTKTRNPKVE